MKKLSVFLVALGILASRTQLAGAEDMLDVAVMPSELVEEASEVETPTEDFEKEIVAEVEAGTEVPTDAATTEMLKEETENRDEPPIENEPEEVISETSAIVNSTVQVEIPDDVSYCSFQLYDENGVLLIDYQMAPNYGCIFTTAETSTATGVMKLDYYDASGNYIGSETKSASF